MKDFLLVLMAIALANVIGKTILALVPALAVLWIAKELLAV